MLFLKLLRVFAVQMLDETASSPNRENLHEVFLTLTKKISEIIKIKIFRLQ